MFAMHVTIVLLFFAVLLWLPFQNIDLLTTKVGVGVDFIAAGHVLDQSDQTSTVCTIGYIQLSSRYSCLYYLDPRHGGCSDR
jgi:uncharacterized transporter YbjL